MKTPNDTPTARIASLEADNTRLREVLEPVRYRCRRFDALRGENARLAAELAEWQKAHRVMKETAFASDEANTALRASLAAAKENNIIRTTALANLHSYIDDLRAQLAAARLDGERMDWLDGQAHEGEIRSMTETWHLSKVTGGIGKSIFAPHIRASIDAARKCAK